jgi:hypothetical protein
VKQLHGLRGRTVGTYSLADCLGHGSWTAVYRASAGNGEHALKLVDSRLGGSADLVERLRREATILDRIGHDGILPIQDAISAQGVTAAAMPLKRGVTLHELMVQGRMNEEFAWSVLSQIAESLDLAHRRGLVYRVLKPGNILVDPDGLVCLSEFGMTGHRVGQLTLATPNVQVADPQYLAPEQVSGTYVDHRADVYAFAVLAFELATGTPLHHGAPIDVLRATLREAAPSASARNPRVPPAVDPVLRRALSADPEQRPQCVWDLVEDLVNPPEESAGAAAPFGHAPVLPSLQVPNLPEEQLNVLDSFFLTSLIAGRRVAGERWPQILELVGLQRDVEADTPESFVYLPALGAMSSLADAFEAVFGRDATRYLDEWGGLVGWQWLQSIQRKPQWIAGPPTNRLVDMLSVFLESMNRVRGEELHGWRQVSRSTFRVVHQLNMTAVGRRRREPACSFWKGAYGAALRWASLDRDWRVAEEDCGCVNGSYACVFSIVRTSR